MALTSLRVRGPYRGSSGYDRHVRAFVRALHALGVAVELLELPGWSPVALPESLRDPWFETLGVPTGAHTTLHFCMPHQVVPEPGRLNVNYTMFEATSIPARWAAASRGHDLVIVPTDSSRRAWLAGGVPDRLLRLCPLGIDAALFGPSASPLQLPDERGVPFASYRARFLNVSDLMPRKNLLGLLRAWMRATSRADDAALAIKLSRSAPGRFEIFQYQIAELQRELGMEMASAAPVLFLYATLADTQMPQLFAAASHYISLSFGEGWDQPMMEAGASGLALIAPDHSAYPAYLDSAIATLIGSRTVPAVYPGGGDIGALFAGLYWWEPDQQQAIRAIRAAIDAPSVQADAARACILQGYTWEHAARRLLTILEELEDRAAPRRFWPGRRSYSAR